MLSQPRIETQNNNSLSLSLSPSPSPSPSPSHSLSLSLPTLSFTQNIVSEIAQFKSLLDAGDMFCLDETEKVGLVYVLQKEHHKRMSLRYKTHLHEFEKLAKDYEQVTEELVYYLM